MVEEAEQMGKHIAERHARRAENTGKSGGWWRWVRNQRVAIAPVPGGRDTAHIAAYRHSYGSYWCIGLDLVLTFVGQILLTLPLVVLTLALFVMTGHTLAVEPGRREFDAWLTTSQLMLVGLLATDGVMLLVLWSRLRRLRLGWSIVGIGVGLRSGATCAVLVGLGVGVVALTVAAALGSVLQAMGIDQSVQEKALIAPLKNAPLGVVLAVVFVGTVVAPVVEEMFFRGYIFRAIAVRKDMRVAYVISAAAFAAFHQLPTLMPVLFVTGLLFCVAYQRTGNLLASITAHAVNNGVAFALALLPWPFQA